MVLPYIKRCVRAVQPVIDKSIFSMGYRCLNRLSKFIKTQKDKSERAENNNVVYKIFCNYCNSSYVGQTKRKLRTRLKEHKANIKLDPSKHSVLTEHIKSTTTPSIGSKSLIKKGIYKRESSAK